MRAKGDIYRGDFTDGKITGKGRYEWAHGSIYEGDFLDGMRDGKGKFTWNYGDVYEGNYVKDLRRGKGKFTYANGEVYEGEFKDNKMHGEGKYTWPDGRYYEGQYDKDLRSGKGHLHWNDGDYEGDFYDNKRHGYGKYTLNTGSVYEGEWDNDKRSGSGTYKFGNGNTYEGRFIDGKISGQGTFTWANGDVYEGSFQDGMRHGKGKFTSKDGKIILNGMWKNDEFTSDDFIYLKPIEAVSARSGSSVEHRAEEAAFATETDSQEPTCKHIVTEPIDFDGGKYVGEVRNGKPGNIVRIARERKIADPKAAEFFEYVKGEFKTFPFCARSCDIPDAEKHVKNLVRHGVLSSYAELVEVKGGIVSQHEYTFYIDGNRGEGTTLP